MAKSTSSRLVTSSGDMEPKPVGAPQSYVDLDKLRSADGIVAIISQRRSTGMITFGVFKEFDRDGVTERTSFIPETMLESYADMVNLVRERIAELKRGGAMKAQRR